MDFSKTQPRHRHQWCPLGSGHLFDTGLALRVTPDSADSALCSADPTTTILPRTPTPGATTGWPAGPAARWPQELTGTASKPCPPRSWPSGDPGRPQVFICAAASLLGTRDPLFLSLTTALGGLGLEGGGRFLKMGGHRTTAGRASCTSFGKRLLETTKPLPRE